MPYKPVTDRPARRLRYMFVFMALMCMLYIGFILLISAAIMGGVR